MENYLAIPFYFTSIITSFFVIFIRKRYFDLFSVAIICSYLYSYPLLIGELYNPSIKKYIPIDDSVYFIYGFFIFTTVSLAYAFDITFKRNVKKVRVLLKNEYYLVLFLVLLCLAFMFLSNPSFLFVEGEMKANVSQFGPVFPLFIWGSLVLLSIAVNNRNNIHVLISFSLILITLIAGIRSYFVTAIIIFSLFYLLKKGKIRMISQYKAFFSFLLIFSFIIFYKVALHSTQSELSFDTLIAAARNVDLILYRLYEGGESNLIMVNLNNSIQSYYEQGSLEYQKMVLFRLLPFVSTELANAIGVYLVPFSTFMHDSFYDNLNFGMGATIFGELAFLGGFYAVLIGAIIIGLIVFIGNYFFIYSRSCYCVFLIPIFVYLAFYFHRIEIGFISYVFYLSTMLYFLIRLFKIFIKASLSDSKE